MEAASIAHAHGEHEHHDRGDDGDHPDERPEGLLLGTQRVEHRAA